MNFLQLKKIFLTLVIVLCGVGFTYSQNYIGTYGYTRKDSNGSKVSGEIVITKVKNKKNLVGFKIFVVVENKKCVTCWCNGELQGTAKFTAPNLAEFDEKLKDKDIDPTLNINPNDIKLCHLTLFFSDNSIIIREKDCDSHGVACDFEGTYKKIVAKKNKKK
jgi:hypothetical protein